MAEHDEGPLGPVITICFMDGSNDEIHFDNTGLNPESPVSWEAKREGLCLKFAQRGRRMIYPWTNIRWYEMWPHFEERKTDV